MAFGDDQPTNPGEQFPPNPYAAPLSVEEEGARPPTHPGEMTLNPWVSIWTKPRATIRQIVDTDPKRMNLLIVTIAATISGIVNGINVGQNGLDTSMMIGAVVGTVLFSIVLGILFWLLGSWLLKIAAGWLGGSATLVEMRAAYAWWQVTAIWTAPLALLYVLTVREFAQGPPVQAPSPAAAAIITLQIVVGIWAFIILCKLIGEVSLFSAWRGWGSLIVAGLLMVIPALVVGFGILALTVAFS